MNNSQTSFEQGETDPKDQGVSEQEIQRWRAATKRLDIDAYQNPDKLDIRSFPRPQRTKDFFEGESEYIPRNPVNNPHQLIRPATLHSLFLFFQGNGQKFKDLKYYEDDPSKRTLEDKEDEKNYIKTVKAFEEFATTVLESLNEADSEKRKITVKEALGAVFNPQRKYTLLAPFDISKASAAETPQGWLVYSVLSIVDNPSDEITPLGRLRALELLDLYPVQELAIRFRSERYESKYYNGYDMAHTPRLPYTFCSREERLAVDHKDIWRENQNIQKLIVTDGRIIDWQATASAIVTDKPEEAVQIALLFMHHFDLTEGGLAILQSIPKLDQPTLSKMFGQNATFLIEHKLRQRMEVEDLIKEGTGIESNVTRNPEEEQLPWEDIFQQLRRERIRRKTLQKDLNQAKEEYAQLKQEMEKTKRRNQELIVELDHLHTQQNVVDRLDPKGYYRRLGLDPTFFEELGEKAVQDLIRIHYRTLAFANHPDRGGNNETMQEINEANQTLGDPNKRSIYGK